ncbi:hypothetical protein PR202_gb20922 [Eleusine coracana subsp. coracana]|uniref:Uncharacterized protein n=1 Tax=Eleusine coracana subsp. coracana TaxID=191504 RepID=A0AAV5F9U3_ELECO|nr:hypothetical protein PR202_gb20922 [Eleusine coracana subsp. coracana]
MQAEKGNAKKLKEILEKYSASTGQKVSEAKSSIYFSPNTRVEVKGEICSMLNIMTESLSETYLDLPTMVGAERSQCFKYLVDRVRTKTKGWKGKKFSMGGKEVLIKSIAQAMVVYAMMVFKIPKKIYKGILDAISQFWWGDDKGQKKMHWKVGWKMYFPKHHRGMGFRDPHYFKTAMLAK